MRITKLDDYQTWLFEVGAARVLVDPWLTPLMTFPLGMFRRSHQLRGHEQLAPTHVVVTAPFGDHLHVPSLALLDKSLPVLTTRGAAKKVRKLGFTDVRGMRADDEVDLGGAAKLRFIAPGFPYTTSSLGLYFEEPREGEAPKRAYLETHVISKHTLRTLPRPLDALLTTTQSVRFLGIQLGMDVARATRTAQTLETRQLVPTGLDPQRATGLLSLFLYIRGDAASLASHVKDAGAQLAQRWMGPGEALEL